MSILALPGCSLLEPEKMPPKPANPTGVSGKHDPQAEQLFAKAHVLWKGETCTDPESAEYLDEALKIEPDYPQALIRRGLALSQLGYADDAFDDLTKAIRLEPSAEAYLSRGICLLQQGNTAGARKDLEEALRRDDRSYRVWNILGAVSLKEGKEQEACEAFEKACSSGDCAGIEAARREKICNSRRLRHGRVFPLFSLRKRRGFTSAVKVGRENGKTQPPKGYSAPRAASPRYWHVDEPFPQPAVSSPADCRLRDSLFRLERIGCGVRALCFGRVHALSELFHQRLFPVVGRCGIFSFWGCWPLPAAPCSGAGWPGSPSCWTACCSGS
ncbi:MAG: tetratricopeptide repeat protein [Bilophila wadsworthia]